MVKYGKILAESKLANWLNYFNKVIEIIINFSYDLVFPKHSHQYYKHVELSVNIKMHSRGHDAGHDARHDAGHDAGQKRITFTFYPQKRCCSYQYSVLTIGCATVTTVAPQRFL